jgi:hypothetical protein
MKSMFPRQNDDAQRAVDARLRRVAHRVSAPELPPGLHERIMRAVQAAHEPAALPYVRFRLAWAAAVAVALVVGGLLMIGRPGQQQQPVELLTRQLSAFEARAPVIAAIPAEHMTAAMADEVFSLAQDISNATTFLRKCMATQ